MVCSVHFAGFIAGIDLEPFDVSLASIGLSYGCIKHHLCGGPYVYASAVASDEGDDWVVGHHGFTVVEADWCSLAGWGELLELGHGGWSNVSKLSL